MINPNFKIDEDILKGDKKIDSFYANLPKTEREKPSIVELLLGFAKGCFNHSGFVLTTSMFNDMIGVYRDHFENEKEEFNK